MMKLKPARITVTQAEARVNVLVTQLSQGDDGDAITGIYQLMVDALHTIANAPTISDKRELKRLAAVALRAHEVLENP